MGMTVNSIANQQMEDAFRKIATGKRINSAGDDAAGLAIAEKITAQINGLDQGTDNTYDMKNLVTTAEGGLSVINDSLQRVRELSLQAANGALNDDDRAKIQNEISQIMQGASQIAQSTEFNNKKLLDGSFQNQNTASSPDGTGAIFSIKAFDSDSLGLSAYDVSSGKIDLSIIDNAISAVNDQRAELGALANRFDSTINSNSISLLNQAAARSRIADADMAKAVTDYNKSQILNQYQITNMMRQQEQERAKLTLLG